MRTDGAAPPPLGAAALASVPGVLGDIARARAADAAERAVRGEAAPRVFPAARAGFRDALAGHAARGVAPAVVAEVKRASPSAGPIADLDPVATARAYAEAGAAAVSVLTEPHRFGGALEHLAAVAASVPVPALRKDFVVHPDQVREAADAGARAVLLIVSVLGSATGSYLRHARALGLDALVEVHDEDELERALAAGADLVGVNNRDLRTLAIDLDVAPRLIARGRSAAPDVVWVAESGYRDPAQVAALVGVADAVLVGTHLAAARDPGAALRRLRADASEGRR